MVKYVRRTPYVSPKIELSNQRTERVDVRVLPVIFSFEPPKGIALYPGQLVDIYIEDRGGAGASDAVAPEGGKQKKLPESS